MREDSIFQKVVSEKLGYGWIIFKDGSFSLIHFPKQDVFLSRDESYQETINLLARKKEALKQVSDLDLK